MIILRTDIPKKYFAENPSLKGIQVAEKQYDAWFQIAEKKQWGKPTDITQSHPKASILKGGRVVFNIKGNSFRLICVVNYQRRIIEIRFFGTHVEYDLVNAETV